jgi:hypothetical protein
MPEPRRRSRRWWREALKVAVYSGSPMRAKTSVVLPPMNRSYVMWSRVCRASPYTPIARQTVGEMLDPAREAIAPRLKRVFPGLEPPDLPVRVDVNHGHGHSVPPWKDRGGGSLT